MAEKTMKAIRVHTRGGPEQLVLEEVPRPVPGPGEVLVRVRAAGVNPPDWYLRGGMPLIPAELRPAVPLPFTPGTDVSGVVVALGPGATGLTEGDEVFGLLRFPGTPGGAAAYAEYVTAPVGDLARKPERLSHVAAAAVPMAGLTAHQYLFEIAGLEKGWTVLVNGAAGGVGHFVVQLALAHGARVIAVASGRHTAFLRGLGVTEVHDYTTGDPLASVRGVDLVVDTVGGPDGHRFRPVVRDGGVITPVFYGAYEADDGRDIALRGGQVRSDGRRLAALAQLLDDARLRPAVEQVFPLARAAAAHTRGEAGHLQGKLVLEVP
ncbi:NADP-dependent oxidoreductase [Actinocorallia sp. API 0066]|uniref:NADP-dependent oxidoreductase n=1 Tax=Actinocorallia sp. API 0066 TaxID=2896846 RepID=UPI001E31A7C6|nr:NADP-dependent oxidoreductase [Actinocorallia sp. API 0066]MCD0449998.1 NADP-dependent oxidoreductase [Actinocorallia sp. API 0066]